MIGRRSLMTRGARLAGVAVAVASVVIAPTPALGARFSPGAAGLGDPYFPMLGNGGYDARHYTLRLAYQPGSHQLRGTVLMRARATKNLSRFDLDLSGMHVDSVRIGGAAATWSRHGQELRITPATGIAAGTTFTSAVTYHGSPKTILHSPIVFGSPYGWIYTPDGAFVGDEPNAAHTWFPVNDYPTDKASYTFTITVPTGTRGRSQRRACSSHVSDGAQHLRVERDEADGELSGLGRHRQVELPARAARRTASRSSWRSTRASPARSLPNRSSRGQATSPTTGRRCSAGIRSRRPAPIVDNVRRARILTRGADPSALRVRDRSPN